MTQLWPSWRYRRAEDGGIESRIFQGPDDIEGEGWVDSPALIVSAPPPVQESVEPDRVESEPQETKQLDFSALSKEDLVEIAEKSGTHIDKRWGRARIEAALKEAS